MPLIFVEEQVLDNQLECVVCPIKASQLYLYEEIAGTIYKKAGKENLVYLFDLVHPYEVTVPVVTSGLSLCKEIIHLIGADMIYCLDFKQDIYNSYERIVRILSEKKYTSVVFPPVPFSYKRLGNMNSYRTCITLARHFIELYDVTDTNIYILTDKKTVNDHMSNYVSTYVSTSYPLSKRHKPLNYPLKTKEELMEYENSTPVARFPQYYGNRNYNVSIKNTKLQNICEKIKQKFKDDDEGFCLAANFKKSNYVDLFENAYIPSKTELIGICMALELELTETYELFSQCNYKLEYDNVRDCEVISKIATHKYDVFVLNEELFLKDLEQVGTNVPANHF